MGVSLSKSILTSSPSVRVKWLTTCVTNYITGNPICQGEKRAGDIFFRPVDFLGAARVRGGKGGGWFFQRDFQVSDSAGSPFAGKEAGEGLKTGSLFLDGKRGRITTAGKAGGIFREDARRRGIPRPLALPSLRGRVPPFSYFTVPRSLGSRRTEALAQRERLL